MTRNDSLEFKTISKHRMIHQYLPKIKTCLEHLNSELVWYKHSEDSNSIGGIVLHLIEHINRNTSRMLNSAVSFEKGIEEYFPNWLWDKSILIDKLERAFFEFASALDNQPPEEVDMYNIYHLVEHTSYHLGQIIDRAQRLAGIRFQFVHNGMNEKALKKLIEDELWKPN